MNWIKHVLVDLMATGLIVAASLQDVAWARWIVLGYTPLMLLLKIAALFMTGLLHLGGPREDAPPHWVFHVLYAVNTAVPLVAGWWLVGGGWALIWALSAAAAFKSRPRLRTA